MIPLKPISRDAVLGPSATPAASHLLQRKGPVCYRGQQDPTGSPRSCLTSPHHLFMQVQQTSGPLHLLSPVCNVPLQISTTFCRSLLKSQLLGESFPDHLSLSCSPSLTPLFPSRALFLQPLLPRDIIYVVLVLNLSTSLAPEYKFPDGSIFFFSWFIHCCIPVPRG